MVAQCFELFSNTYKTLDEQWKDKIKNDLNTNAELC